jgi:hypothetical protein
MSHHEHTDLNLSVTYPAAREPFHDHQASRDEPLGNLKGRVLVALGLEEGTSPDGTVTSYWLYHGKQALEDMTQTLGAIAGAAHALHLKLAQQIVQG